MPPLERVLRRELRQRGWREYGLMASRVSAGWVHEDGEKAISLNDAILKQLIRDSKSG